MVSSNERDSVDEDSRVQQKPRMLSVFAFGGSSHLDCFGASRLAYFLSRDQLRFLYQSPANSFPPGFTPSTQIEASSTDGVWGLSS